MTEIEEALRQQMDVQQKLAHSNTQIAAMQGELRGSVTAELRRDEVLHNNLRAREWIKHDPTLRLTKKGDAIVGLPDGWPPEVDGEEVIASFVGGTVSAAVETTFGKPSDAAQPVDDSPSVRRLREVIG